MYYLPIKQKLKIKYMKKSLILTTTLGFVAGYVLSQSLKAKKLSERDIHYIFDLLSEKGLEQITLLSYTSVDNNIDLEFTAMLGRQKMAGTVVWDNHKEPRIEVKEKQI